MSRLLEFLGLTQPADDSDPTLWFDRPNALRLLRRRRKLERLADHEYEALRNWVKHGYIRISDLLPTADLEGMMSDLDNIWTATEPIESLVIEDVRVRPEDSPGLPHEKLVSLDQDTRNRLKRESKWRVHGFYRFSEASRRIYENPALQHWASLILGRHADPYYTINFAYGSVQELHQDSAVFYVWPMNCLVGAWVACEDIHPDSGPLVYYPGSHKERFFPAFENYPQTNLKNCDPGLISKYNEYLKNVAERYEAKTFVPKRGEIFLWHGMLIHGGSPIKNRSLTRRSYVCHYLPKECDKISEAKGPFNW